MKVSIKKGFGFGLTSGIITTLGLIVGLNSGTHSRKVIIGGILIIAIADALSDAFGIHISEESTTTKIKQREIWESTISTFLSKLVFALTFVIPILFLELNIAIIVSIIWGILLLVSFSFHIAKTQKENPKKVILEHLIIAILVIAITHLVGLFVSKVFT